MKTIIGLAGVKESGKTTSFNIIRDFIPSVTEITIAKRLKDVCAEVFSIRREAFDDQRLKELELRIPVHLSQSNVEAVIKLFGYTPNYDQHVRPHIGVVLDSARRVAQYIGTEVLRRVDTDIHCVGATLGLPETGIFVVTDLSFSSEYDFFQSRFPHFYPFGIRNYAAESKVGPQSHPSELGRLELAKGCEQINNNSTLEELKSRVLAAVGNVLDRVALEALNHAG